MKFGRAIRSYLVWATLLAYLLVSFGSAFGAVWCAGEEEGCGSKPAGASCCRGEIPGGSRVATQPAGQQSCSSCTDIALSRTVVKSRVRPSRSPLPLHVHLETLKPLSLFSCGEFKSPVPPRVTSTPSNLVLAQLRTVVLLH